MKNPKLITLLLLLFAFMQLNAQERSEKIKCGTDQLIEDYKKFMDPDYDSKLEKFNRHVINYKIEQGNNKTTLPLFGPATYVIPVVVHIMHNGVGVGTGLNLAYAQIESQIDALNAAFAMQYNSTAYPNGQSHPTYAVNTEIQFCLAKDVMGPSGWTDPSEPGVMRYSTAYSIYNTTMSAADAAALKSVTHPAPSYFPFENYLNIWVVSSINNNVNLIGYAPTPILTAFPLDGVVMRSDAFGDNTFGAGWNMPAPDLQEGKTLAHEVGHYLHLFHIFDPLFGCDGMNASGSSSDACDLYGDFICDIEPSFLTSISSCSSPPNTCTATYLTGTTANDMIEDYMSYADDPCKNTFTTDQRTRMWATLNAYRPNLFSLGNLSETGVLGSCVNPVFFCDIQTSNHTPCVGETITIWNPATGNTANGWNWSMPGASTTSSSGSSSISISYSTPGIKTVTLLVTDGFTTETCDIEIFVTPCEPDPGILPQCQWNFGNEAVVTFFPTAPGANSAMNTSETCATMCDASGNLLFYTNGISIWDATNATMTTAMDGSPNTNGNFYEASAASGVTICPDPGNSNRYYVFYTPDAGTIKDVLKYTIVDMTVPPGNIVSATLNTDVPDYMGNTIEVTEGVTVIPSCNGQDFWVIAHGANTGYKDKLLAYLVTPTGVAQPVVSTAFAAANSLSGYVTTPDASRDGNLFAASSWDNGHIYVYNFDNATGTFTLHTDISSPPLIGLNVGISFSPNGNYLYSMTNADEILQFDITTPGSPTYYTLSFDSYVDLAREAFQLGPDNRLYIGKDTQSGLAIINFPDDYGAGMGFMLDGVDLGSTQVCRSGLPNEVDARLHAYSPPSFTVTYIDCETVQFDLADCWKAYRAKWNFGDGSGTVFGHSVTHTYTTDDDFTVTLELSVSSGSLPLVAQTISVYPSGSITITGPSVGCINDPDPYVYAVPVITGATYAWSLSGSGSGTITGSSSGNSIDVDWLTGPSATVNVTVTLPNCTLTTSMNVTISNMTSTVAASPSTICVGATSQLLFGATLPSWTFEWSTGETTSSIWVSPTATSTYTVTVTNSVGCSNTSSVTVTVFDYPASGITCSDPDCEICIGESITLSGDACSCTYLWSPGSATTDNINISPSSTTAYTVTVTNAGGCSTVSSATVTVNSLPSVSIDCAEPFCASCKGEEYTLTAVASCSICTYVWSPGGATGNPFTDVVNAPTTYTVTVTDENGCTAEASVNVDIIDCDIPYNCRYIDNAQREDVGRSVVATDDGGFTIVGDLQRSSSDIDMYWLKYNAAAENQLNNWWGNYKSDIYDESGFAVLPVEDGYFIIGTVVESGRNDFAITKFNMDGSHSWRRRYTPSTGVNRDDYGRKIVRLEVTPGNWQYYAVGYTNSFSSDVTDFNAFVMSFDPANGTPTGFDSYGETDVAEKIYDACADNSNNFILLAGESIDNNNRDMVAYKVDFNLLLSGQIKLSGSNTEYANSICMIPGDDEFVYLAGSTASATNGPDIYIVKVDFAGFTYDSDRYFTEGANHEWANCIIPVPGDPNALTIAGANRSFDGILMNIDTDLNVQWSVKSNRSEPDIYTSVALLTSGEYAITGYYTPAGSNKEVLIIIADARGNSCCSKEVEFQEGHKALASYPGTNHGGEMGYLKWGAINHHFAELDICGGKHERGLLTEGEGSSLLVIPNPGNGLFKINLNNTDEMIHAVLVYDVSGRLIHTTGVNEGSESVEINLEKIQSGIYSVIVTGTEQSEWHTTISIIR